MEDLAIRKPLVLAAKKSPVLQCVVDEDNGSFRISSRGEKGDSGWAVHVVGKVGGCDAAQPAPANLNDLRERLGRRIDKATHYRIAAARGLEYGPAFQAVEEIWAGEGEVLSRLAAPSAREHSLT